MKMGFILDLFSVSEYFESQFQADLHRELLLRSVMRMTDLEVIVHQDDWITKVAVPKFVKAVM